MADPKPHQRRYQQGELVVVVEVGANGMVTMPEEQLAAVLTMLGCTEVSS